MNMSIVRIIAFSWLVAATLFALPPPGRAETFDDASTIPCIPDVAQAIAALSQRRGGEFVAYLHQTGDKYIRNRDFRCLYDLLKIFAPEDFSLREAKLLLLYRTVAQLGKSNPIGAAIEYDWLEDLGGLEKGSDFAVLLDNRLDDVSQTAVDEFRHNVDRHHRAADRNAHRTVAGSALGAYLVAFSAERIAVWDYLTLKRCIDAIDPEQLNPAEQLYVYSIAVLANLKLNRVDDAYAADVQYRALAARHPDLVITGRTTPDGKRRRGESDLTRFYMITRPQLDAEVASLCDNPERRCGPDMSGIPDDPGIGMARVTAVVARLETRLLSGEPCTADWWCLKRNLERVLASTDIAAASAEDRLRLQLFLARSTLMLGDDKAAYQQLWTLNNTAAMQRSPFAKQAATMLDASAASVQKHRKATLRDKLVDLSEAFYFGARNRLIGVAGVGLVLIFVFIPWHRFFKQSGHNTLALIRISGKVPVLKKPGERFLEWLYRNDSPNGYANPVFSKKEHARICGAMVGSPIYDSHTNTVECRMAHSSDMVDRLSRLAPYPLWLLSRLPGYRSERHVFYTMGCGALVSLVAIFAFRYGRPMSVADKSLLFFLLTATLVAALTGMRIMSRKVLGALKEIATMLDRLEDLRTIEKEAMAMFRSPWQFFVAFLLYGLFFIVSQNQLFSTHVVVGMIILMICPIHWMMISSLLFTRVLCDMQHLSINPLSPLKTWGLQKWFAVIGTFATTGSIVITVASATPVLLNWENLTGKDLLWICAMLPLLIAYWVYPYFKIRDLVRDLKLERMHIVKTHISNAYDNWQDLAQAPAGSEAEEDIRLKHMEDQIDRINRYHNLFRVIDQSPEFFVDIYSIFELAKVMGIPSFFALLTGLIRFF